MSNLTRYPTNNSNDLKAWMRDWISYYKENNLDPSNFFNPTSVEYFPKLMHESIGFKDNELKIYKEIKSEFINYVIHAKSQVTPFGIASGLSRIGDVDDFDIVRKKEFQFIWKK